MEQNNLSVAYGGQPGEGWSMVEDMLAGYGPKFSQSIEEFFANQMPESEMPRLLAPFPALGRYYDSCAFMEQVTSGLAISKERFQVIVEYAIALSEEMEKYTGLHSDRKVIDRLSDEDKRLMRAIGRDPREVYLAQLLERFTEHDSAAAGDYVKLAMAYLLPPHLTRYIEGVLLGITSEDMMGNVFGITSNRLVFGHLVPAVVDLCLGMINYVRVHEENGPLIVPGATHLKAAEYTTAARRHAVILTAIVEHLKCFLDSQGRIIPFSGKLGGPIGDLKDHYAAYPDINWHAFARKFVEKRLKLSYHEMTDQCSTYYIEAQHLAAICNLLTKLVKFTGDILELGAYPGELLTKTKPDGMKGSTGMPQKSNFWEAEGVRIMFKKGRNNLRFLADELPNYPLEGNMERSFLMRDLGTDTAPIFIGLGRLTKALERYIPQRDNINTCLNAYPGMSSAVLQTVLKRMQVPGDAYRAIQKTAVRPDGSAANSAEFRLGLEEQMEVLELSSDQRQELLLLLNPKSQIAEAHQRARKQLDEYEVFLNQLRVRCRPYQA